MIKSGTMAWHYKGEPNAEQDLICPVQWLASIRVPHPTDFQSTEFNLSFFKLVRLCE